MVWQLGLRALPPRVPTQKNHVSTRKVDCVILTSCFFKQSWARRVAPVGPIFDGPSFDNDNKLKQKREAALRQIFHYSSFATIPQSLTIGHRNHNTLQSIGSYVVKMNRLCSTAMIDDELKQDTSGTSADLPLLFLDQSLTIEHSNDNTRQSIGSYVVKKNRTAFSLVVSLHT